LRNAVAMRGEVKLGVVVGLIFLVRFIWVQSRRSGGGRWVGSSVRMPQSKIRGITDWGIYLGVGGSVVSGLMIAYLRPGAELIPQVRRFTTSSPALNATIDAHAFISNTLEWLCGFHAVYALWYWLAKRTEWGRIAGDWVERATSNAGRVGWSYLRGQKLRL
jgi:cytochrome b561